MNLDFNYQDLDFIQVRNDSIKIIENQLWANKGHTMNEGMVSPDKKYFYLNIPKNSSSFVKDQLILLGWEFSKFNDHPSSTPIIILRDPINRWISGITEYMFMYHLSTVDKICEPFNYDFYPLVGESLGLSLLFERMTFDDHTERQCVFLKDIPPFDKCIWVNMGSGFSDRLSSLLTELGYPNTIQSAKPINTSDGSNFGTVGYKKQAFKKFLEFIISKDLFKQYNLTQWFWCDTEVMNKVKFYEPR